MSNDKRWQTAISRVREALSLETIWPWAAKQIENFARTRAVGLAPELLAFAILQLTITPTLERGADFATESVDGRLSRSLAAHRIKTVSGRRAFDAFGAEWARYDRSIRRAVTLMAVAIDAPQTRRQETLTDALDAVLDGARDRVVEFSTAVRGPAMGIYAFGVMLPLALVGLLPVLASSGGGVSTVALAIGYDLIIPLGLAGSGLWLWARRPAVTDTAFDSGLLTHARSPVIALGLGGSLALIMGQGARLLAPAWTVPLVTVSVGVGTTVFIWLHPAIQAQTRFERLETRLPDALDVIGQRLTEGHPVETTVASAASRFDGPLGDLFERASARRERSGEPLKTVFLADNGLLTEVPSQRVHAGLSLAFTAAEYGPSGGKTLLAVGSYLDELLAVEREAKRKLAQTTSTLRQTAVVFAPAIAGVTVALATGMEAVEGSGHALDVAALGLVIGVYVLLLGVVLPGLSVVLERGFDPVRLGYRSSIAVTVSGIVYPLSFLAARTLVYV